MNRQRSRFSDEPNYHAQEAESIAQYPEAWKDLEERVRILEKVHLKMQSQREYESIKQENAKLQKNFTRLTKEFNGINDKISTMKREQFNDYNNLKNRLIKDINLQKIKTDIIETLAKVNGISGEFKEMNKKLQKNITKNKQDIAEVKQTEISSLKQNCQKFKNDVLLKIDDLKKRSQEQIIKLKVLLKESEQERSKEIGKLKQQLEGKASLEQQEKNQEQNREEEIKNQEDQKLKKVYQKFVNQTTPYAKNFELQDNNITLKEQIDSAQMVLLDVMAGEEAFSFLIHIRKVKGDDIGIGVTDRVSQMDQQCPDFSHSILYLSDGHIYYGSGEHERYQSQSKGDLLSDGMEVVVEVDRRNTTVSFTLKGASMKRNKPIDGSRVYSVRSPILKQPGRQFVPCFVMCAQGQSVSYEIE